MTTTDTAPALTVPERGTPEYERRLRAWNTHPHNVGRVIPLRDGRTRTLPMSEATVASISVNQEQYRITRAAFESDCRDAVLAYRTVDPEDELARFRYWNDHPDNAGRVPGSSYVSLPLAPHNLRDAIDDPTGWPSTWAAFHEDEANPHYRYRTMPSLGLTDQPRRTYDPDDAITVNDPRVRHLWVEAAMTAEDHDWCNTYETVAQQSNVPTRAELRATGELKQHTTVTFSVAMQPVRFEGAMTSRDVQEWVREHPREAMAKVVEQLGRWSEQEIRDRFGIYSVRAR